MPQEEDSPEETKKFLIPRALRKPVFRFVLVKGGDKIALEKGWQDEANYSYDNERLLWHVEDGGNYGVLGGPGSLAVVDIDNSDYLEGVKTALPPTFTVRTKKGLHLYFIVQGEVGSSRVLKDAVSGEQVGDLKAGQAHRPLGRGYVVGPGSLHPEGTRYQIVEDKEVAQLSAHELVENLRKAGVVVGLGAKRKDRKNDLSHDGGGYEEQRPQKDWEKRPDPEYFQYLPFWYRTHHRARNGRILRGYEGRIAHLRICATLKKYAGENWEEYAHDITDWMFGKVYDADQTRYQLQQVNEDYAFGPRDFFFYKDISPNLDFLRPLERREMVFMFEENLHRF